MVGASLRFCHDLFLAKLFRLATFSEFLIRKSFTQRVRIPLPRFTEILSQKPGFMIFIALQSADLGSNLVAIADGNRILKVFPPFLKFQWESERLALRQLFGKISISTPELLHEGEMDGWYYLIMTKLEGESLKGIWPKLLEEEKRKKLHQIGSLIAEVHRINIGPLAELEPKWSLFISQQRKKAYARHEKLGLPIKFLEGIEHYLDENYGLIPSTFESVILTGEYTPENILVKKNGADFCIEGLIDFGDVMVGLPEYDLLGPSTFLAAGDPNRLMSLFSGYGYSEAELNSDLLKRLTSLLLMHRYSNLAAQIGIENWQERASNIEELEQLIWKFG